MSLQLVTMAKWLACLTAKHKIRHHTSAETHMWGKQLDAMLVIYTNKGVVPEVYSSQECISHTPQFRIEFYRICRIYRICRKLFLFLLIIKITKNSLPQIL